MDNRIFNVNGIGINRLFQTVSLWVNNTGYLFENINKPEVKFEGYKIDPKRGFILLRFVDGVKGANKMPSPMSLNIMIQIAHDWLQTAEAQKIPMESWDSNAAHDGSNELGWRVYCDDWGFVESQGQQITNAILIAPAYMWYGK